MPVAVVYLEDQDRSELRSFVPDSGLYHHPTSQMNPKHAGMQCETEFNDVQVLLGSVPQPL